jgi:hypothetical protein
MLHACLQAACVICYCAGVAETPDDAETEENFDYYKAATAKEQCKSFASFKPLEAGVNIVIAGLVTIVNTILGLLIYALTKFERHISHTEEHAAQFYKTAIAQYLNTSISPLIASAEVEWLSLVFGGVLFKSGYPDFTTNWCTLRPAHYPACYPVDRPAGNLILK